MALDFQLLPFAHLITPLPWTGCWLWDGRRFSRNGYGRVWHDGKERQAHRVTYELLVGPIPQGLILDHLPKCRVRCCVNPDHLEPVTHRTNTLRGEAVLFRSIANEPA
jgi:hypothetical protein